MTHEGIRIPELVRRAAVRHPGRVAVEHADTGDRWKYAELWDRVECGASMLQELGLDSGDCVLLTLPAGPDWIAALLSIAHADSVAVPIPVETPANLAWLAARFAGARVWVGDPATGAWPGAGSDVRGVTAAALLAPGSNRRPPRPVRPGAAAVYVFTSGSTSRPRAVALSHEGLRANLRLLMAVRRAVPGETLLSVLPPSHAYELVSGQLAPLATGARVAYTSTPLPNRLLDAVAAHGVTRLLLVPALLDALAREVARDLVADGAVASGCDTRTVADLAAACRALDDTARSRLGAAIRARIGPSLRVVVVGGAAADPDWHDVLSVADIGVDVGYGLTEAGPVVTLGRAGDCPPGLVGRPLPGVDVRVSADAEILVRSDAVMLGYVGDPLGNAAAFDDGWLRTGDRGRLDEAGHVFVVGRIKDAMVTSNGETIYPDEIEPHYASPLFAEHAVVPGAGPDQNDRPTLVVVPADEALDAVAVERAVATLRAAVPPRLRITDVVRRAEPLPRSAAGKVRRRMLADELRRRAGAA